MGNVGNRFDALQNSGVAFESSQWDIGSVKSPLDRVEKCLGDSACAANIKRCVAAEGIRRGIKSAEDLKVFFREHLERRTDLLRRCLAEAEAAVEEKEEEGATLRSVI